MVAHACNPRNWKLRQDCCEFSASLGYVGEFKANLSYTANKNKPWIYLNYPAPTFPKMKHLSFLLACNNWFLGGFASEKYLNLSDATLKPNS